MENKEFHKIIGMGNSNPNSTEAEILKLKRLLDRCIQKVGGLQQDKNSNPSQLYYEWENVRGMVGDIAMALTGRQINFVPADNNLNSDYHENYFENKNYKNPLKEGLDEILNDEYKQSETIKAVKQLIVNTLKDKKVRKFLKLAEQVANEVKKKYDAR